MAMIHELPIRLQPTFLLLLLLVFSATPQLHAQSDSSSSKPALQSTKSSVAYDPLQVDANQNVTTLLFDVEYRPEMNQRRASSVNGESRKVPVKVYLPERQQPAPVVLFSHGLGGSREGFKHGGEHWARRGYVAVFLQHPGSDESVWREKGLGQRMSAMREAANAQNLLLRIADVKAVIDCLEKIEQGDQSLPSEARELESRMDLKHIGMSGHSFGAITTQMVSGQSPIVPTQKPTDARIRAAIILSPSQPKIGQPERYFGQVNIPWLLMTGTKDDSPIGDQSAESRLKVFPALPAGDKFQVVFEGGTHAFLGERGNMLSPKNDAPSHARATEAITTAFWDAYLRGDEHAQRWLDGDGVRSVLAKEDQWMKK